MAVMTTTPLKAVKWMEELHEPGFTGHESIQRMRSGIHTKQRTPAVRAENYLHFDGVTYDAPQDQLRLTTQLERTIGAMADGYWRTFKLIAGLTNDPESSISARLRDMRKDKFQQKYGRMTIERRRVEGKRGLWEYRLVRGIGNDGNGRIRPVLESVPAQDCEGGCEESLAPDTSDKTLD